MQVYKLTIHDEVDPVWIIAKDFADAASTADAQYDANGGRKAVEQCTPLLISHQIRREADLWGENVPVT